MKIPGKIKMAASAAVLFTIAAGVITVSAASTRMALQRSILREKEASPVNAEKTFYPMHVTTRNGYFVDSYLVDFGWNLNEPSPEYPASAEVVLGDGSKMTVAFCTDAKQYADDEAVKAALAHLIDSQRENENIPEIKTPFVERVTFVPVGRESDFAEGYYKDDDLVFFSALFPSLEKIEQLSYFQKMYDEDNIAFFSCATREMDAGTAMQYIDKTEEDGKTDFFALLSEFIPQSQLQNRLEKYYHSDDVARFSILFDRLSDEEQEAWRKKAKKDGNRKFYSVIVQVLLDKDFSCADESV